MYEAYEPYDLLGNFRHVQCCLSTRSSTEPQPGEINTQHKSLKSVWLQGNICVQFGRNKTN